MDALTDCCAFGERALADASLACTELAAVVGIRHDPHSFAPSGALDDFNCVVPTPRGYVAARCRTENARKSYVLTLPDSVPAEVNVDHEDTVQIIRY